jgi:hypothetical protein
MGIKKSLQNKQDYENTRRNRTVVWQNYQKNTLKTVETLFMGITFYIG